MSILVELPETQYAPKVFADFSLRAGFTFETARAMAWMSQLAYETRFPDKIERIASGWDLGDVRVLQQPARSTLPLTSTHGVMATAKDAMIIAFAGTDPLNLLNWISDFYVGRVEADVHQGFEDAADAVWTDVGAAIERNMNDGRALFIAGHSLGAAIALVIADRARREKGLRQGQVYVFGSPRVGRADFVGRYNAIFGPTTYRFVHGRDIVATVPPSELGFHHVGRLLQCDSGQKFDRTRLRNDEGSDDPQAGDVFFSGIADQLARSFFRAAFAERPKRPVGGSLTTSVPVHRRPPTGSLLHRADAIHHRSWRRYRSASSDVTQVNQTLRRRSAPAAVRG